MKMTMNTNIYKFPGWNNCSTVCTTIRVCNNKFINGVAIPDSDI